VSDYAADLELALRLADGADAITMRRFLASDLKVESKPDLSPVSDADRAVEEYVRAELAQDRPGDALVGEEFGTQGSGPRRWVIDPIDGTKNYVRGVPVWATLIALIDAEVDADQPVVGVVSAPALGRRWWAARGAGAWANGPVTSPRRLSVSGVSVLGDASLSYSELGEWGERLPAFLALNQQVWRGRAYGDFWSYMLVAEGAVDLAAEPELSLWDMAALAPIVTEAGGRFTGLNGADGVTHSSAVASNGLLHDALLAALNAPLDAPAR
jgi:histidinol-phosphatase